MLITYRRTGGLGVMLALGTLALVAGVLTLATIAAVLIAGFVGAAVLLVVRSFLPRSWRSRTIPPAAPWPHETIEGTVVKTPVGRPPDPRP